MINKTSSYRMETTRSIQPGTRKEQSSSISGDKVEISGGRKEDTAPMDGALKRYGKNLLSSTKHGAMYYMQEAVSTFMPGDNASMGEALFGVLGICTLGMVTTVLGGVAGAGFGLFGAHIDRAMGLPLDKR